jgi:ADP-heptose:LPS heptosyltransferase
MAAMQITDYQKQWISIRENGVSRKLLSQLARQVALSFLHQYYENGHYGKDYIDLLSEMATFSSDPEWNIPACSSLFGIIVEQLCDDYEEFQFEIYAQVMSQVISYCRDLPQGKKLDRYLNGFRLYTQKDICDRAHVVHTGDYTFDPVKKLQKICILSRVTIGSDVAIVSVAIQRLHRLFPHAEIVLLGSAKLQEIFGGNPHVRIQEVNYSRRGDLFERFASWFHALEIIEEEIPPEGPDSMLIIDPDSRISQLGLLPLTSRDNHLFVNTHENGPLFNLSMAELTNEWITRVFNSTDFCYPKVWVQPSALEQARRLAASLRQSGCRRITAINFGVGGNERKRLGIAFEQDLVCELLKEPGTVVLLDKGFGDEETAGSLEIVSRVRAGGYSAIEARFGDSEDLNINHGVYNVEAGIGEMAALIAESDDYIGYDSACQHIAAALAVPTITVFAGTDNPAFVRRWSACGNTSCAVVHVESSGDLKLSDTNEIINRIMHLRAKHALRPGSHRNLS